MTTNDDEESPDADGDSDGGPSPQGREGENDDVEESTTVSPEFETEFPSVATNTDESASPSAGVGEGITETEESEELSPADAAEAASSDGLGWQGWVLVGGLIVAMVLVPWAIVFLPEIQGLVGSLGLGLRDAYLFLPMIPAVGLGLLAVWAALAYRRRET